MKERGVNRKRRDRIYELHQQGKRPHEIGKILWLAPITVRSILRSYFGIVAY